MSLKYLTLIIRKYFGNIMIKWMGIRIIGIIITIIIVIIQLKNNCNFKIKINCPMKDLNNLENVVYQDIISPKENIKEKKNLYRNFISWMEIKV